MLRKHFLWFWYCLFLQLLPSPRLGSPLPLQIAWCIKHFSSPPSSRQSFSLTLVLLESLAAIPDLHSESHMPLVFSGESEMGSPGNTGQVREDTSLKQPPARAELPACSLRDVTPGYLPRPAPRCCCCSPGKRAGGDGCLWGRDPLASADRTKADRAGPATAGSNLVD